MNLNQRLEKLEQITEVNQPTQIFCWEDGTVVCAYAAGRVIPGGAGETLEAFKERVAREIA